MIKENELVTIAEYVDVNQARMAVNFLQAEGISAWLENETIVTNDWMLGQAVGNVRLKTASDVAVEAAKILDSNSDIDPLELEKLALQSTREERGSLPFASHFYTDGEQAEATISINIDQPHDEPGDTEEEIELNSREELILKAYRASILFLILPFLSPLLTWMLIDIASHRQPIRPELRRKLIIAIALHLPVMFAFLAFLRISFRV